MATNVPPYTTDPTMQYVLTNRAGSFSFSTEFLTELFIIHFDSTELGKKLFPQVDYTMKDDENQKPLFSHNCLVIKEDESSTHIVNTKTNTFYDLTHPNTMIDDIDFIEYLLHRNDTKIINSKRSSNKFTPSFMEKIIEMAFGRQSFEYDLKEIIQPQYRVKIKTDIDDIDTDYSNMIYIDDNCEKIFKITDKKTGETYYQSTLYPIWEKIVYRIPTKEEFIKCCTPEYFISHLKIEQRLDTNILKNCFTVMNDISCDTTESILFTLYSEFGKVTVYNDNCIRLDFYSDKHKTQMEEFFDQSFLNMHIYLKLKFVANVESPLYWRNNKTINNIIITHFYLNDISEYSYDKLLIASFDKDLPYSLNFGELKVSFPSNLITQELKELYQGKKTIEECLRFTQEYANSDISLTDLKLKYEYTLWRINEYEW